MNRSLKIRDYMRASLRTIGEDIALNKASEVMRDFRVRHIPVLSAGKLVGVISDRDARLALSIYPAARDLVVGDVMTEQPYAVSGDANMSEVLTEMTIHKYGCAIVVNEKRQAIGIFTASDAVRILGNFFGEEEKRHAAKEPAIKVQLGHAR